MATIERAEKAKRKLELGSAPGPDEVPPGAIKLLITSWWPDVFRKLVNRPIRETSFPRIWTEAKLVLTLELSCLFYSPICLLI